MNKPEVVNKELVDPLRQVPVNYFGVLRGTVTLVVCRDRAYHTILNEDVLVVLIRCVHVPHMQAPRVIVQVMCELML